MRYLIFSSCYLETLTKYGSDWRPETLEVGFVKSFALAHFRQLFEQIGKLGINVLINAVRLIKIPCNVLVDSPYWATSPASLGRIRATFLKKAGHFFEWLHHGNLFLGYFHFCTQFSEDFHTQKTGKKRFPKRHFDACPQTSLGLAREALAPPPPEASIVDCKDGIHGGWGWGNYQPLVAVRNIFIVYIYIY